MGPYLGTPKKEKDSVDGENERVSHLIVLFKSKIILALSFVQKNLENTKKINYYR